MQNDLKKPALIDRVKSPRWVMRMGSYTPDPLYTHIALVAGVLWLALLIR